MKIKVNPNKKDIKVFDPFKKSFIDNEKPTIVQKNEYWLRRLRDGDIVIANDEDEVKPDETNNKNENDESKEKTTQEKDDEKVTGDKQPETKKSSKSKKDKGEK